VPQPYQRNEVSVLLERLSEPQRFLIVLEGPRQIGKTRLVRDALANFGQDHYHYVPVDSPEDDARAPGSTVTARNTYAQDGRPRDAAWLIDHWRRAREAAKQASDGYILVFDEIQKIPRWSETVKGLWDADRAEGLKLHVILLGSSPLLMQKGMSESLAGRIEAIRLSHWSFLQMYEAFDFDLDDYIYFGGYPGSASLIRDETRWRNYVRTSLIEPNIEKDILSMTRVDKPALLKQLFYLGCEYSGQLLSYTKMIGQLQDAGNTVTLAHYLDLLGKAGLIIGLQKYAGQQHRRRASVPKFNVLDQALMSAASRYTKMEAKADRGYWGRMVQSTVGAHLYNSGHPHCKLHYWRDSTHEVDYVIERGNSLAAIEVKSGTASGHAAGLDIFEQNFGKCRKLVVGEGGIPLVEFLSYPAEHWLG